MLRLTDDTRKVLQTAKDAGTPLYATGSYADFLLGKGNDPKVLLSPTPGLDPLGRHALIAKYGDCVDVEIRRPKDGWTKTRRGDLLAWRDKHKDADMLLNLLKREAEAQGPGEYTLSSGGVLIATLTIAPQMLPVWVNGAESQVKVPANVTREERHKLIAARHAGNWAHDRYQIGDEAPYFFNPEAEHYYEVKDSNGLHRLYLARDLKSLAETLREAGVTGKVRWAYQDKARVWQDLDIGPKTVRHAAVFFCSGGKSCAVFETPANATREEVYQAAMKQLIADGHRPAIHIDGSIYA